MGLLFIGTPFEWQEAKEHADHVRKHGILQFIAMWNKLKNRKGDGLYWGDEVLSPQAFIFGGSNGRLPFLRFLSID